MSHTLPLQFIFFRVVYPTLLWTSHFCIVTLSPLIIRGIATPPNHNYFSRMACQMFFGVFSQRFRAANQSYPKPLTSPQFIPSNLYVVALSHERFYFLNSLSLFSKYMYIHIIFSRFIYPPPFSRIINVNPLTP